MNDLEQLAALDPARGREPTAIEWTRSQTMLERVMATEATPTVASKTTMAPKPSPGPRRPVWRMAMVGVVAVAVGAVAAVAVPSLLPGTAEKAFASWTPAPGSLTGEQVMPQARVCAGNGVGQAADGQSVDGFSTVRPTDVLLAEQRGLATLLIMRKDSGAIVECLSVGPGEDEQLASLALTDHPLPDPPAGTITLETMSSSGEGRGQWSNIVGQVGAGVTGVDVRTAGGRSFQASVRNGWWAAWWPGPEGGEVGTLTVTVHAAEGTTTHRAENLP